MRQIVAVIPESDRRAVIRVTRDWIEVMVSVGVGKRKRIARLKPVEARRVASLLLTSAKRASARKAVWTRKDRGRELYYVGREDIR